MITKDSSERIVWLEKGTKNAGMKHIISEHGSQFANKGITKKLLPDYLKAAVKKGKIVGYQGKGKGRPIYELLYRGHKSKVAITSGNNGFIVGANPK